MNKIGIVTLFGYNNYGNRLQMYASQEIYKNLGFETEIIRHFNPRPLKGKMRGMVRSILDFTLKNTEVKLKNQKVKKFKENSKKYFKESNENINSRKIDKEFHKSYSFFSVGSDQIWSPGATLFNNKDFIFLKFAPKEKRIALSPSFGKSEVPNNSEVYLSEALSSFSNLSVREDAGAKIIEKLTGRQAEVLVDPTMILSEKEWIDFSEKHELKPSKKYILTYFLGPLPEKVKNILKKYNEYEIVKLSSLEMKQYYDSNPSEWIDFVKDADLFLTDSFHGVVFAHIFKTPFSVYDRIGGKSMGSRITTILNKFNMQNRHELSMDSKGLFNVDFSTTEKSIEKERKKTMNHLKKSLKIVDDLTDESA